MAPMSDIPQYNITAQRRNSPRSIQKELGSLSTTPANVSGMTNNAANANIGNKAAVATMDQTLNIASGANVQTQSQKQASNKNSIDTGKNVIVASKQDVNYANGQQANYPVVEDAQLNADTVRLLQKKMEAIQQSNKSVSGPSNSKAEIPMSQRNGYDDWVKISVNKDGTGTIENYGVWDKITGRTYGNNYTTDWKANPQMLGKMAIPLAMYANTVDQMDTTNQLIYGTKTLGQVLDAARGGPGKNILSDNGIIAISDLADMAHNWNDRNSMQNAEKMIEAYQSTSEALGYETYPVADGFSLYTFGNGAYQMYKNWDKMNDEQKAASTFYLTMAGIRAYEGANNLYDWAIQAGILEGTAGSGSGVVVASNEAMNRAYNASAIAAYEGGASSGSSVASTGGASAGTNSLATTGSSAGSTGLASSGSASGAGASSSAGATSGAYASVSASEGEAAQAAYNAEAITAEQSVEQGAGSAGTSSLGTIAGGALVVAGAMYSGYDLAKSWNAAHDTFGHGSVSSRKAWARTMGDYGQVAGTIAGAIVGSLCFGQTVAGASIGSFLGRLQGTVEGLAIGSIKVGKSDEQRRRDQWRASYSQAGVFYRIPKDSGSTYAIRLADGQYYDVGHDGSGSRATDIRGNKKQFADPSMLTAADAHRIVNKEGKAREVLPYEVDYTNGLDFGASLMLNSMIMPIGGSGQLKRSAEVGQMLGYMTNGVTSNTGREFTQENWNTMVANIRSLYSTVGITSKSLYGQSLADAYYSGRLSYEDYQTGLMTMGWIYDEDGYQQAAGTLGALGKLNGQTITSGSTGVAAPAPISGDTRGITA